MSVSSFGLAESNRFDQFDHLIRRFPEPRHERPTHQHALAPSSDKRVVTKPSVFRLLVISTEELPACDLESVRFRRSPQGEIWPVGGAQSGPRIPWSSRCTDGRHRRPELAGGPPGFRTAVCNEQKQTASGQRVRKILPREAIRKLIRHSKSIVPTDTALDMTSILAKNARAFSFLPNLLKSKVESLNWSTFILTFFPK